MQACRPAAAEDQNLPLIATQAVNLRCNRGDFTGAELPN